MDEKIKVGAIILSAGNSSRMKTPKALLSFDAKNTFIQKIISTYLDWGCKKIAIVTNTELAKDHVFQKLSKDCTVVLNEYLDFERFYSAKIGAQAMIDMDYCFLQDSDNPFTSVETLQTLYENKKRNGVIIPSIHKKGGHPILIGKAALKMISKHASDNSNLKEVLQSFPLEKVEVKDKGIWVNINTPEDYHLFFRK